MSQTEERMQSTLRNISNNVVAYFDLFGEVLYGYDGNKIMSWYLRQIWYATVFFL